LFLVTRGIRSLL